MARMQVKMAAALEANNRQLAVECILDFRRMSFRAP